MKRVVAPAMLVVVGALSLRAATAGASDPQRAYEKSLRVAHVKAALVALEETPPAALQKGLDFARALGRGACSAGAQRLRVECLIVAMKRYCQSNDDAAAARHCPTYMDVLASNVLADEILIPPERRYQIVRENVEYRPALARELRRIQGTLAADFRLQTGDADDRDTMAANVDRYCLANADEKNLSYQICVSSLVWFIKGPK